MKYFTQYFHTVFEICRYFTLSFIRNASSVFTCNEVYSSKNRFPYIDHSKYSQIFSTIEKRPFIPIFAYIFTEPIHLFFTSHCVN